MNKNFLFRFMLFCLLSSASLQASYGDLSPNAAYIESFGVFGGNAKGKFRGDAVIILSDGSHWKVDPKDQKKISYWNINDVVHIGVRTSFFLVRHHKFTLHNHSINESARVMLVAHPEEPLQIIETQTYWVGNTIVYGFFGTEIRNKYVKQIVLSDGSVWEIANKFDRYTFGNRVYVAVNVRDGNLKYFLTSGTGSKGQWCPAFRLN